MNFQFDSRRREQISRQKAERRARDDLRQAFAVAFCNVVNENGMHPMSAMRQAAAALGEIYANLAERHRMDPHCPCGWRPQTAMDMRGLVDSFCAAALAGREEPRCDAVTLYDAPTAGNA